jgi:hypothetical protein
MGLHPRKVDDLAAALGADTGISKSEVARICPDLHAEVGAFRDPLTGRHDLPQRLPDATPRADRWSAFLVVIATGVAFRPVSRGVRLRGPSFRVRRVLDRALALAEDPRDLAPGRRIPPTNRAEAATSASQGSVESRVRMQQVPPRTQDHWLAGAERRAPT